MRKCWDTIKTDKAGFGSFKPTEVPPKRSHDYRKLIATKVTELEEEVCLAKAVQLHLHGNWTKWCDYTKTDLSWKFLLSLPQCLVSFFLGSTFDTLPSPSNLKRWKISAEAHCFLCRKSICTTAHILSGCKIALVQGRYTYRHDSVLKVFESALSSFLTTLEPITVDNSLKACFC